MVPQSEYRKLRSGTVGRVASPLPAILLRWRKAILAGAVLVWLAMPLPAATVFDTAVDPGHLDDSRSMADGGLIGSGRLTELTISWNIRYDAPSNLWNYAYRFLWDDQDIGHITLSIFPGCTGGDRNGGRGKGGSKTGDGCTLDPLLNAHLGSIEFGDKDGITSAVKFDDLGNHQRSPLQLTFASPFGPTWGDIYLKSGRWSLQNAGLGQEATSTRMLDFIAAPGSASGPPVEPYAVVPEPGSGLLMGAWLLALGVRALRENGLRTSRGSSPGVNAR